MSKPFEEITEAGFELLQQILEQADAFPSDFFFDEPTVDGQIELLQKLNLVKLDDDDQLSITELGRAALKHHDYIMEQNAIIQKQRAEELEAIKTIAVSATNHAESAKNQSEKASHTSKKAEFRANLSIIIAILSCIASVLANADKIIHNLQKILSYLGMLK